MDPSTQPMDIQGHRQFYEEPERQFYTSTQKMVTGKPTVRDDDWAGHLSTHEHFIAQRRSTGRLHEITI